MRLPLIVLGLVAACGQERPARVVQADSKADAVVPSTRVGDTATHRQRPRRARVQVSGQTGEGTVATLTWSCSGRSIAIALRDPAQDWLFPVFVEWWEDGRWQPGVGGWHTWDRVEASTVGSPAAGLAGAVLDQSVLRIRVDPTEADPDVEYRFMVEGADEALKALDCWY